MKKIHIFLIACSTLALVACSNGVDGTLNPSSDETVSPIAATDGNVKELEKSAAQFRLEEEKRLKDELASSTTMALDKLIHDYGKVKEGSHNTTTFKVTNTGKNPLIISNVSASCGCTTPKKPEGPIAPGASDVIEVEFSPKVGQGPDIEKTVTITANTQPVLTEVKIKATAIKQ